MDTAVKPVQTGRGRRRRWSAEQKVIVLQEWQTGIPLEEICRKYAMHAAQMYRYNREAPHGALNMQSPVEFYAAWFVKNKTRPVHN